MATGYQRTEPSSKFCEILRIGRRQNGRRVEPPVVTIYYKYKSGREEVKLNIYSRNISPSNDAPLKCTCLLLY